MHAIRHAAGEEQLNCLDSSIKRNSALVKRLRGQLGPEDGAPQLLADIPRVNQSKVNALKHSG